MTVLFHTIKASIANPVNSLRSEWGIRYEEWGM